MAPIPPSDRSVRRGSSRRFPRSVGLRSKVRVGRARSDQGTIRRGLQGSGSEGQPTLWIPKQVVFKDLSSILNSQLEPTVFRYEWVHTCGYYPDRNAIDIRETTQMMSGNYSKICELSDA